MESKGFVASLFDISFKEFITPRIISILYVIAIVIAAIGAITSIVSGFAYSAGQGILMLILSPIFFILYVIFARVWLEVIIILFRIADNTRETAANIGATSVKAAPSAPEPPAAGPAESSQPEE